MQVTLQSDIKSVLIFYVRTFNQIPNLLIWADSWSVGHAWQHGVQLPAVLQIQVLPQEWDRCPLLGKGRLSRTGFCSTSQDTLSHPRTCWSCPRTWLGISNVLQKQHKGTCSYYSGFYSSFWLLSMRWAHPLILFYGWSVFARTIFLQLLTSESVIASVCSFLRAASWFLLSGAFSLLWSHRVGDGGGLQSSLCLSGGLG